MFLQVNIPLECKFLLPRVENEKANDDKNLHEPHLHSAKSHSGGEVEQAFSGVKCSVKIIHGILTRLLLFLETNVNTRTHDTHVNRWEVWVENGEGEFTKWEFARCASYQLVAEWADDSWKKAATGDLILKGFRQYDYVEYAWNISVLHSTLEETVKKHQFPEDIILEVNEFLEEIMALQLEEESADEEVTDEPNKNCIANDNENEKGETNGHNDDIDATNLLNAKDFKNKI